MYGHALSVGTGGSTRWGSTVHPPRRTGCCPGAVRELTADQCRTAAAYHEAGHAAVARGVGLPARGLTLASGPPCPRCGAVEVVGGHRSDDSRQVALPDLLAALAAGAQAELLWLDRTGLFTGARAWCAEVAGLDDQELARRAAGQAGVALVHERPADAPVGWNYRLQELRAVRLLDGQWTAVARLAEALDAAGRLSAVEVTRLLSWGS